MSDKTHKIIAIVGSIAVVVLPILAHSAWGANANVRTALDVAGAVLAARGFTVVKPLSAKPAIAEPLPLPPPPKAGEQ